MGWHWTTTPAPAAADAVELGVGQQFPTQGDAESWLGEFYPELAGTGVTAVSLYEEGRLVYGPMPLDL